MIGHVTYLDIPAEHRARLVAQMREQVHTMMTSNFMSPDQVEFLQKKLAHLEMWKNGHIPVNREPARQLPSNRPHRK